MKPALRTIQGLTFSFHGPSYAELLGSPANFELVYTGEVWQLWGQDGLGQPKLCHFHRERDNLVGILAYVFGLREDLPKGYHDRMLS